MRKVLSVIHFPIFGGLHNQVLRLHAPLAQRGWEVIAVLPEDGSDAAGRLRAAGIRVIQMPLHRPRKSFNPLLHVALGLCLGPEIHRLSRVIRDHRIDVVQVSSPMNPHGALAARLEGVAVVWQLASTFTPKLIRRIMMPFVMRFADVVMSWGFEVARSHRGATELGERLVLVFPPVDTNQFRPDEDLRRRAREALGVSGDNILVGTVGNLNWMKGHEFLVRAAAVVCRERPDIVFRILGAQTPSNAAYYQRSVVQEARQLGLLEGNRLRIVEPGDQVAELLPAFDLFVLTSRLEGVPTAVLEAMSCGLPVVVTDVGAVRELVEDGITGYIVPPLDPEAIARAILRLARAPDLRGAMGEVARRRAVERYDVRSCAETHIKAYELAIAHRRKAKTPTS